LRQPLLKLENNSPATHFSDMTPTIDQLADGLMRLGYDDEDTYPLSEIPFDVWNELQQRGHVERGDGGNLRT
jgi:hypothetical protein